MQLGLELEDLRSRFLDPENAEVNLHIHPILKGLYCICERIVPSDAKLLIDFVTNKDSGRHPINFTDEKYLEIFLLHWLAELVIEAGEWSPTKAKRNVFCQLDSILEFLKVHQPTLADLLQRIVVRFNFTARNVVSVERKTIVTDVEEKSNAKSTRIRENNSHQVGGCEDYSSNGWEDKYRVERETAGYVLIINQVEFYADKYKTVSNALDTTMDNLPFRILFKKLLHEL